MCNALPVGVIFSGVLLFAGGCASSRTGGRQEGRLQLFDGKTLTGWEGDPVYWRVENGCLVGEVTPATLLKRNTFIIWRGGTVADFELEVDYRISPGGNSGINYRSEEIDTLPLALRGYQGDIAGRVPDNYTGMNYEERRRTTLAKRGQKVEIPSSGPADSLQAYISANVWTRSIVTESFGSADSLGKLIRPAGQWNHYTIRARGNRLQHFVNGVLMSEVVDNDPVHSRKSGLLGVQVHVGPPMKVEFRDFRLRRF